MMQQTKWLIKEISKTDGPDYVRLSKIGDLLVIYDEETIKENNIQFEIGKAVHYRKWNRRNNNCCRSNSVAEALKAQEELLKGKGIDARVVDMHTIKPIDTEAYYRSVRKTRKANSNGRGP